MDNNNDRYIITEFLEGGSVFDLLHKSSSSTSGSLFRGVVNKADFQGMQPENSCIRSTNQMCLTFALCRGKHKESSLTHRPWNGIFA